VSYWIHPEAEEELGQAAQFYATEASRDVALAFLVEFERVRDLLIWNQEIGIGVGQGFRIFHLQKFPYSVIYAGDEVGPQIYAVCHQRRKPGYWKNRA
jgi:toxin ParE1/3/4